MLENNKFKYIKVLDPSETQEVANRLKTVLKLIPVDQSFPAVSLVKREVWSAVPVANEDPFNEPLLRIAQKYNYSNVIAMTIGSSEKHAAYSIPCMSEAFQELYATECSVMNSVLFAGSPDWLIIIDMEDFYIAAGPEPIVTTITAKPLGQAFRDFQRHLENPVVQGLTGFLTNVYQKTRDNYQNCPVGSEVVLMDY